MKKSQKIALVLITAALASCHKEKEWNEGEPKVYMRGDSTAVYSQTHHYHNNNNALLWYMAFRPYGVYSGGSYHHVGMYNGALSESSNFGRNTTKSSLVNSSSSKVVMSGRNGSSSRSGFGSSAHSSSSSHSSAS